MSPSNLCVSHWGCLHPGLPSLGSSSLVRITHARKRPKGLYEIHGSFYIVVCCTSCTENLQGKAMGLLCPYLLLAPCGVIPGQSLGRRLWFTETHIWLSQFFSTLLPGLSCETTLISQQVQIHTLPVKYKLYSKEVYFWRSCHIHWVIPCATEWCTGVGGKCRGQVFIPIFCLFSFWNGQCPNVEVSHGKTLVCVLQKITLFWLKGGWLNDWRGLF